MMATLSYDILLSTGKLSDPARLVLEDLINLEKSCEGKDIPLVWRDKVIGKVKNIHVDGRDLRGAVYLLGFMSVGFQIETLKPILEIEPKKHHRNRVVRLVEVIANEFPLV